MPYDTPQLLLVGQAKGIVLGYDFLFPSPDRHRDNSPFPSSAIGSRDAGMSPPDNDMGGADEFWW